MRHPLLALLLLFSGHYVFAQDQVALNCEPSDKQLEEKAARLYLFTDICHPPTYPGGERAIFTFIRENGRLPEAARLAGILSADIVISFVVETDGSLSSIEICRDVGYGCGEEAVRLVKRMRRWRNGQANGYPCRVWMYLPVRLRLSQQ